MDYQPRVVDPLLRQALSAVGATLIEGPKACGKSRTAEQVAATTFRMDIDDGARALVANAPELLLGASPPVLFDEWQVTPELWNLVRRAIDDNPSGQYVLTGSASPNDDVDRHSGAGRISTLRMRPMSLFESGRSTGQVSIAGLFDGEFTPTIGPRTTYQETIAQLVIGGWPSLLGADEATARRWLRDYLSQIIEVDIQELAGRRDPQKIRRTVAALARATGTETSSAAIAADVLESDAGGTRDTINRYHDALERLMLIENVPAWAPHLRSKAVLRQAPTRYLTDPSLAIAALGGSSAKLLNDPNATGFFFENLVVRDLRTYCQGLDAELFHYRDSGGSEVDVIIQLADGRWAAIEVKINPKELPKARAALDTLVTKVDLSRSGPPVFRAMVTSFGNAMQEDDGVFVLPTTTLGP